MTLDTVLTASNQTQVPAALRKANKVRPGDIVTWEPNPDGTATVRFRKKRTLADLIGIAPGISGGDAVQAKKRAQRGGR